MIKKHLLPWRLIIQAVFLGCCLLFILYGFGLFSAKPSLAKISGKPCAHCHVMHAQEQGVPTAGAPGVNLLNSGCLGCHTGQNGTDNTPQAGDTPYVLQAGEPNYGTGLGLGTGTEGSSETLAGGNFYWVQSSVDANGTTGHNVIGINSTVKTAPGGTFIGPMNCAGSNGCHGNRSEADEYTAMHGTHHQMAGVSSATSYRFLDGVGGTEDSDWEWQPTTSAHNIYQGKARTDDSNATISTISGFCAICHSKFHYGAGTDGIAGTTFGSPWLRHPVDFVMPSSGDYASYSVYSVIAPVASDSPFTSNRIITCITCHRAHGTPFDSILRWNYKAWPGVNGYDGCGICHSSKR